MLGVAAEDGPLDQQTAGALSALSQSAERLDSIQVDCADCEEHHRRLSENINLVSQWVAGITDPHDAFDKYDPSKLLNQEMTRQQHLDGIDRWRLAYDRHRFSPIHVDQVEENVHPPEITVSDNVQTILRLPLTERAFEEELQRACVALGQIHELRRQHLLQWLKAPVRNLLQIGITIGSAVAATGVAVGGLVGGLYTVGQYSWEFNNIRSQRRTLARIEMESLRCIQAHARVNRQLVTAYLAEAGVENIDQLLSKS